MAVSSALQISDPSELPRAAAALGRHADGLHGVQRGVDTACGRIETQVDTDVRTLRTAVQRAQERLNAVDRDDEAALRRAQDDLARAKQALAEGARVQGQVDQVLTDLRREVRDRVSASRSSADQGAQGLRSFWERLDRTRSAFSSAVARHRTPGGVADPRRITGGGQTAGPRPSASGGHTEGPLEHLFNDAVDHVVDDLRDHFVDEAQGRLEEAIEEALSSDGPGGASSAEEFPVLGDSRRAMIPLDRLVDFDPIAGPADFERLSMPQMRAGVRLLEERVLPALRRGFGREQIRAMDVEAGTAGSPDGLLAVYDAFFGGEEHAVVVNRRPDGTFSVEAGRHRFWVAQRLLLDELPVLIR